MKITAIALCLFSLAAGCATPSSSVAVEGKDVDVSLLAGLWEGSYEGIESRRKGTIRFDLYTGQRVAEGKVMMNDQTPLSISFVKVASGELNGKIEPYPDPACNCTVETKFVGELKGDQIEGTFTTTSAAPPLEQHGIWKVKRTKK
jgi:hypothetical protein